jgi:Zn ribbon nucleic-acid-binding protein
MGGVGMVVCPECRADDLELVRRLQGTARIVRCLNCGHEWQRGELPPQTEPGRTREHRLKARFATATDVPAARLAALDRAASSFEQTVPPGEEEFIAQYEDVFSRDRLPSMTAEEFQRFYRSTHVASAGYAAWGLDRNFLDLDPDDYTRQIREAIEYLLYSPKGSLESRLTDLIDGRGRLGVLGVKETALTKVLAVMYPDEIFPLSTYDSPSGGKRQIARKVLDLELPARDSVDWTIGRLIIWSGDLFTEVGRRWFEDLRIASRFFWSLWRMERGRIPLADWWPRRFSLTPMIRGQPCSVDMLLMDIGGISKSTITGAWSLRRKACAASVATQAS